ncbi:MAG: MurT ligase domain-containing protein [Eubacteriales bacterium]|nr:MurT ligase domain-containing protein [Eubacteriales bacterium]
MKLRTMFAILSARIVQKACRMAGRQGVTLAGKVAWKIDPGILEKLAKQVKKETIVVCGTNGKTTTNNLLCAALEAEGKRVICNHTGSNMLYGIVTSYVLAAKVNGKLEADYACIEIDEASTVKVFPHLTPDYMILTNLFRDQLDRYGEIDTTIEILKRAIEMVPDMKLIVNGDDALLAYLAEVSGHETNCFGVNEPVNTLLKSNEVRESGFCKKCGAKLEYEFYHYSQLGPYHCPKCDFKRPRIKYNAADIRLENGLAFTVDGKQLEADYRGFYNVYNILAVYSAISSLGVPVTNLEAVLQRFSPENGRNEKFRVKNTEILLNLAKNPAGFNQNIDSVMTDTREKDLIIVINDNAQDGKDISWLWDVDFEKIDDERVQSIVVSGIRGLDMRLRLKYANIPSVYIEDVKTAIEDRIQNGCGNLYVLVNYTALYSAHKLLKKMEAGGKV